MKHAFLLSCLFVTAVSQTLAAQDFVELLPQALEKAGDNRPQIAQALKDADPEHRRATQFLVAYMPERDLTRFSSEQILENVRLAYRAWKDAPWSDTIPEEIFLNEILPYANINERRDNWRAEFRERFRPLVADAKTASEAAAILNQKVFPLLKVKYSTKRKRADQGPRQSMESGLASCTGLSILLIDACRSVGVPARFAGTPLWSNKSGNHSWVEIWDNGWHFTGAAEPSGDQLNRAWFVGRASEAQRDHPLHAIYAVSYRHTPQRFPLIWDRSIDYVYAVNVTDRYTALNRKIPDGHVEVQFRIVDGRDRCAAPLKLFRKSDGELVFSGKTKDERFDANDHLSAIVEAGTEFRVEAEVNGQKVRTQIEAKPGMSPVTIPVPKPPK